MLFYVPLSTKLHGVISGTVHLTFTAVETSNIFWLKLGLCRARKEEEMSVPRQLTLLGLFITTTTTYDYDRIITTTTNTTTKTTESSLSPALPPMPAVRHRPAGPVSFAFCSHPVYFPDSYVNISSFSLSSMWTFPKGFPIVVNGVNYDSKNLAFVYLHVTISILNFSQHT